jgi:uncharacterized protein (TIGR00299 family) protein
MRTAYFHCASGISGDMCLGALVHAGASFSRLKEQLALLPLNNYQVSYENIQRNGISAGKFHVRYSDDHPHRHLKDILKIINEANLAPEIKEKSGAIFSCLAQAEAKVHGTTPDKIHFHEVGAVDAIIDIVGTVICLNLLGVEKVISSPLPVGHGFITCAHGTIPLPAPATREILKGIPQYGIDIEGELVTPTGAAIIATLAQSFGQFPKMTVDATGYGAGTKEYAIPNILSVSLGEDQENTFSFPETEIGVIEASIDDMNPEFFSYLWEVIFSRGALDMYFAPVYMKKGRPGTLVTILAPLSKTDNLVRALLQETSTLGVRTHREFRFCCPRKKILVPTKYGDIAIKIGSTKESKNLAPEYEACKRLAQEHQVPLKEIYLEALIAAKMHLTDD